MKKRTIKISSLLIAAAVIAFSFSAAITAQAASLPEFTLSSASCVRPGETVEFTVDVNENRGYCAGEFLIKYDSSALTPVSITKGEAASEYFVSNTEYGNGQVFFAVISTELMADEGTVATLTFKAKDSVVLSSSDLTLSVNSLVGNRSVGYGLNSVKSTATGGEVHIAKQIFVPDADNTSIKEELGITLTDNVFVLSGSTFRNLVQTELNSNFTGLTAKYFDAAGNVISAAQKLTTGYKIKLMNGSTTVNEFAVSVSEDVNGDFGCNGEDAMIANLVVSGALSESDLSPEQRIAADADGNGTINSADIAIMEANGLDPTK
ncbi:MAG: hypothetical protein IJE62_00965 [Clostridia bacterium]|nr:hypothetical protein [Clostridia bacterium]MBQ3603848.1 hypothetical protein [Clostridia bacterium]